MHICIFEIHYRDTSNESYLSSPPFLDFINTLAFTFADGRALDNSTLAFTPIHASLEEAAMQENATAALLRVVHSSCHLILVSLRRPRSLMFGFRVITICPDISRKF